LIGGERAYYENIINSESQKIEELMSGFESVLNEEEASLEDLQRQADKMEHEFNEKFEELSKQMGLATPESSMDEELMLRKEKVAAKEVELKASQAQLEELDKQYL
jgi:predicted HicB family RNase H-like nuclease